MSTRKQHEAEDAPDAREDPGRGAPEADEPPPTSPVQAPPYPSLCQPTQELLAQLRAQRDQTVPRDKHDQLGVVILELEGVLARLQHYGL